MRKNFVTALIAMVVFAGVVISCKAKADIAQVSNSQPKEDSAKKSLVVKATPEKQLQGEWGYIFENENNAAKIPAELYVFSGSEYIHYYFALLKFIMDKGTFSVSEENISFLPVQLSTDNGESWRDMEDDELTNSVYGKRMLHYSFSDKETLILPYQRMMADLGDVEDVEFKKGGWQSTFKSFISGGDD